MNPITMTDIQMIPATDKARWMAVLEQAEGYDFYHLPAYHTLNDPSHDGEGMLMFMQEREKLLALPLLMRPVGDGTWLDATSVYGYPGPLISRQAAADPAFIARFHQALTAFLIQHGVVSVFSRLHPILRNHRWLGGLGALVPLGQTVAIDLSLPPEQQWAQYRSNHRRNIRRLRRMQARVIHDRDLEHLETFTALYTETMRRVRAHRRYFFTLDYFKRLFAIGPPASFHLFVCEIDGEIVSGGVFSHCQGVVQYHLGGTATAWLKQAPMKLIFDQVRIWAHGMGARWFHLGGGVGSSEDSLFRFKAGFSSARFPFYVWKWIVQPDAYQQLVEARRAWYRSHGRPFPNTSFFPAYRQ